MKRFPGLAKLGLLVPYLAVAIAGSCNVAFTRMDEITNGVAVSLRDGAVVGTSILAGQQVGSNIVLTTTQNTTVLVFMFSQLGSNTQLYETNW